MKDFEKRETYLFITLDTLNFCLSSISRDPGVKLALIRRAFRLPSHVAIFSSAKDVSHAAELPRVKGAYMYTQKKKKER